MVRNISQIVFQLFQKETLDEVSESELRYFIRQYPYAGTGHLLLAKKLQLEGEKRAFEREIAVTSIYFNNPAWLQFILQEAKGNGDEIVSEAGANNADSFYNTATIRTEPVISADNGYDQPNLNMHDIENDIDEKIVENDPVNAENRSDVAGESETQEDQDNWPGSAGEIEPGQPETTGSLQQQKTGDPGQDLKGEEAGKPQEETDKTPLFYDDGEVFAEFIAEEANEEIRLNEETLNAHSYKPTVDYFHIAQLTIEAS
ncbi:MAG: hypothetical protein EOO02_24475 [Chitinophagaceae bacterium]|nr:MAG: hypothetical protein EOO02_24475 [Chitinophagaceae bacterium]